MKIIALFLVGLFASNLSFANSIHPESRTAYALSGQVYRFASFAEAEASLKSHDSGYLLNSSRPQPQGTVYHTYKQFTFKDIRFGGGAAMPGCAYSGVWNDISQCPAEPFMDCKTHGAQNISVDYSRDWKYSSGSVQKSIVISYTKAKMDNDGWVCDGEGKEVAYAGIMVASGTFGADVIVNKRQSGTGDADCETCNPINLATGNKRRTEVDYKGKYLEFVRYYNSQQEDLFDANLGHGWTHSYSDRAIFDEMFTKRADYISMKDGLRDQITNGNSDYFVNRWVALDPQSGETHYVLEDQLRAFNPEGYLIRIVFNSGLITTIERNPDNTISQVVGPFGSKITFVYDETTGEKLLSKIILPDNNEISYSIDARKNLVQTTYQDGSVKGYHYEDPNFSGVLTGITDENGDRYATFGYNELGEAILSELAGGFEKVSVQNSSFYGVNTQTTYSNSKGASITRKFKNFSGIRRPYGTKTEDGETTSAVHPDKLTSVPIQTYDANQNLTKRESSKFYNAVMEVERASGTSVAQKTKYTRGWYSYHGTRLSRPKATITDTYQMYQHFKDIDGFHQKPYKITYTDLSSNTVPYSTQGNVRDTFLEYDGHGLLSKVDGPRTDVNDFITYERDDKANLIKVSVGDCLGSGPCLVTTYSNHNDHGQPQRITDSNGIVTDVVFHVRGWILESTTYFAAGAQTTSYQYDLAGQLKKAILPNGDYLSYEHNGAHYMTAITNSLGERIELILDTEGNVTQQLVKDAQGTIVGQQNKVFSATNRLLKLISGEGFETTFIQDPNGNITSVVDHLGNTTGMTYDPLNRISKAIDAKQGTISKTYNSLNKVATITDQNGNVTSYTHNGFGDLIQTDSPDTGIEIYWLDAAGNMTSKKRANGVTVNYTHDALNRQMAAIYPNSVENVGYNYDTGVNANGKLSSISFEHGTIAFDYIDKGMADTVTHTIKGNNYVISSDFDQNGKLSSMTYPSGMRITYSRDASGHLSGLIADGGNVGGQSTIVSDMIYGAFGTYLKGYTYGNGITKSIGTDKDGQVTSIKHSAATDIFNEGYVFAKPNQISDIVDNLDPNKSQSFIYSSVSELLIANGPYGQISYSYDPVSNRKTRNIQDKSILESYSFANNSNQLLNVMINGLSRDLSYDLVGNTTFDNKQDKVIETTVNQQNRPASTIVNGLVNTYGYNPFGQRIIDNNKVLIYGNSGELLSIMTPTQVIDYIYLSGEVVATAMNGVISYHHNNYMSVTRVITDNTGEKVWEGDYLPFGELRQEVGELDNVLRLPGQYNNPETGYYYNYYRDYDPALGRYLQSDPIGLAGGLNTYGYVNSNPINLIDIKGLAPWKGAEFKLEISDIISRAKNSSSIKMAIDNMYDGVNRYLYSDKYGWIDLKHAADAAKWTNKLCREALLTLGFGLEVVQLAEEIWNGAFGTVDHYSAFSPEDLISNIAGADYFRSIKKYGNIEIGTRVWLLESGVKGYSNAPKNLPKVNPAKYGRWRIVKLPPFGMVSI